MNRRDYRAAFDAVDFSADFEERTLQRLAAAGQPSEKEQTMMHMTRMKKTALLTAAAVALLAVSVSAAVLWLSPAQVADRAEKPLLAEAFQGDDAILLDESVTAGDYQITLAGMVSGEDLSYPMEYNGEIINDRTYAVFRVARADGEPLTDYPNLSYSPLVDGYHVRCVNAWTLGTTTQQFIEDGVIYCLFDCRNLEMFADHPVRFAIYEGGIPNTDLFSMAEAWEKEFERMSANEFLGEILITQQMLDSRYAATGDSENIGGVQCDVYREKYDDDRDRIWVQQSGSNYIIWQEQDGDWDDRETLIALEIASLS